jgi:hypothetical protein
MKKIILIATGILGGVFLASNAFALTILPPLFEIGANPGDSPTRSIGIFNETDSPLELYTSTSNFTAKPDEEGSPEFLPTKENESSLATWIDVEKGPITVMPNEQRLISYTINIPQNADPGGHYAAIFFSTQPSPSTGSSIGLSGKLGTLILLTVSGNITEEGKIVNFALKDPKPFYDHLPVSFSLLFTNTGNVHLKPQGEIKITNLFGRVSDKIPFNKEEMEGSKVVLPNTSRHLGAVWTHGPIALEDNGFFDKLQDEMNNFALGRYKADLTVGYGTRGEASSAAVIFWIFPWRLILVFLIVAAILIFLVIWLIRNYNRL